MSKERIDLTQFEGMFEGGHPKHLFDEVEKKFKDGGVITTPLYLNLQYVNAITLLPDLLAELNDLRWKHMQVLRERKDLRDEALRLARKLDILETSKEE